MIIAQLSNAIVDLVGGDHTAALIRAVSVAQAHTKNPALHALSNVEDCTATEIATALFRDAGFSDAVVIPVEVDGNDL